MASNFLANMTPEQRTANLALAHKARADKAAFREANKHLYKTTYMDVAHWATLATKYKVRMPSMLEPVSAKLIMKYLKKCKLPVDTWNDSYTSAKYFISNNSTWTAYAVVGLMLEMKDA